MDLRIGKPARFAAGSPTTPHSSTWTVVGGRAGRDLYVGNRAVMHMHKLSLHESGRWRLAETDEFAKKLTVFGSIDEDTRVLGRFTPPAERTHGWQLAVTIIVTDASLMEPEPSPSTSTQISWWPAPANYEVRVFAVYLSDEAGAYDEQITFTDDVVASLELPKGARCVVVTTTFEHPELVSEMRSLRAQYAPFRPFLLAEAPDGALRFLDLGINSVG